MKSWIKPGIKCRYKSQNNGADWVVEVLCKSFAFGGCWLCERLTDNKVIRCNEDHLLER